MVNNFTKVTNRSKIWYSSIYRLTKGGLGSNELWIHTLRLLVFDRYIHDFFVLYYISCTYVYLWTLWFLVINNTIQKLNLIYNSTYSRLKKQLCKMSPLRMMLEWQFTSKHLTLYIEFIREKWFWITILKFCKSCFSVLVSLVL